jgi:ACT domain-containing protein
VSSSFEGDRIEDNEAMAVLIDDAAAKIDSASTEKPRKDKHKRYITKTLSPIAKAFNKPVDILIIGEYVENDCEDTVDMIERALHVKECN